MEEEWANGGGFGFPNPLCQPLHHIPEDESPVYFPSAVQCAENGVADCDRHPSRLIRVDDRNHELQQSSMPVDLAVAHRVSVLGVHLVHKPSFVVALHPVGQPGSSSRKSVHVAPQACGSELGAISDRVVEYVRPLRLQQLLDHLLPLQRLWAIQQPFAPHPCQVLLELLQVDRVLRNAWRYIPERDRSCLWGRHLTIQVA